MTIFFTGAVRGGRDQQQRYAAIIAALSGYGTVLSQHVADETLSTFGETNMPNADILARELAALEAADIVVAEVTTPSHGVGYFLGRATALGKRVIALHEGPYEMKVTGILQGDSGIELFAYADEPGIADIFKKVFSSQL